ncbi:MAG: DedA family protein [Candidatus Omnitrophica bacterium]|nr:DedA family protein [Candidatus Omnitrophota bacterium]
MDFLKNCIEFVIHIDKHLGVIIQAWGSWSYLLLFIIIFAETGLVITPFLPGDSLLFAVGAFAAAGSFNIVWLFLVLFIAAVAGDSLNYAIGKFFGERLIQHGGRHFLKKEHIEKTHMFYQKYGGKTIILARFVPIVRTFAPFVAGIGKMDYFRFFIYNVAGALLWVGLFVLGGYYFGNIPVIKETFFIVITAVIVFSVVPVVIEFLKHTKNNGFRICKGLKRP